jgi:hypothetical protein
MYSPIYIYAVGSFVLSAWAAYTMGLSAGFYAILSSALFVIAEAVSRLASAGVI